MNFSMKNLKSILEGSILFGLISIFASQLLVDYLNYKNVKKYLVKEKDIISISSKENLGKPPSLKNINLVKEIANKNFKEAIKEIDSIEKAEIYVQNYLFYKKDIINDKEVEYYACFKKIHERKTDDCDGMAIAAAALLSDDGYPAYLLRLYENFKEGHVVFLYKVNGKFGSIGHTNQDNYPPRFNKVSDLVKKISKGMEANYKRYEIINLSKYNKEFIDVDINHDPGKKYQGIFDKTANWIGRKIAQKD